MPVNHRMENVAMAMDALKNDGVPFTKSATEYTNQVNNLFTQKPQMPAMAVSAILPSIVYANEPGSRKTLDDLIKKHKVEKIEI